MGSRSISLFPLQSDTFRTKEFPLAYMGVGLDIDPEEKTDSGSGMMAVNANIATAMETIFGANKARGHLPVNVPEVVKNSDGTLSYGEAFLYERGAGIIN